jgi:hypothetical protein
LNVTIGISIRTSPNDNQDIVIANAPTYEANFRKNYALPYRNFIFLEGEYKSTPKFPQRERNHIKI